MDIKGLLLIKGTVEQRACTFSSEKRRGRWSAHALFSSENTRRGLWSANALFQTKKTSQKSEEILYPGYGIVAWSTITQIRSFGSMKSARASGMRERRGRRDLATKMKSVEGKYDPEEVGIFR